MYSAHPDGWRPFGTGAPRFGFAGERLDGGLPVWKEQELLRQHAEVADGAGSLTTSGAVEIIPVAENAVAGVAGVVADLAAGVVGAVHPEAAVPEHVAAMYAQQEDFGGAAA
jgi:hypothetical protein